MQRIGPYQVTGRLGSGAMGVVFQAHDPSIGRDVAIKLIHVPSLASQEERVELQTRFRHEASAAGRLSHPNIVTVYHMGQLEDEEYLVMELIVGHSLQHYMSMSGREANLPYPLTMEVIPPLAAALDYAHSRGVIHRDVKPANVLLSNDGTTKLTDFGIARITSQTITRTGLSMGTPSYMAPEQFVSSRVGAAADQYSLAAMTFHMLTGRKPFTADTDPALMFKIASEPPPSLHEYNSRFRPAASDVIKRALSKDPAERFKTCSNFVDSLIDSHPFRRLTAGPDTYILHTPKAKPKPVAAPQAIDEYETHERQDTPMVALTYLIDDPNQGLFHGRTKLLSSGIAFAAFVLFLFFWPDSNQMNLPRSANDKTALQQITQNAEQKPVVATATKPSQVAARHESQHVLSLPTKSAPTFGKLGDVTLDALSSQDRVLQTVSPSYPVAARSARIQGDVALSVQVGVDGSVERLDLISGHPLLVKSAEAAVLRWKYRPMFVNGQASGFVAKALVHFRLTE